MSPTDRPRGRPRSILGRSAPDTLEEALARARRHGRKAALETVWALRAVTEAAALAARNEPASARRLRRQLWRVLEEIGSTLARASDRVGLLEGATTALDAEIARWETRSRRDPEARAVLRVFLGLREVLWELGVRESSRAESRDPTPGEEPDAPPSIRRRRRVERVPVED
ncbi:MAG: hypothetical protein JSU66_04370 [Deltaproteobacteria bacterium]|nr:MAG: hypothetical protein JSU66_04370 [Deltaproteobacteria bacterium]